MASRQSTTTLRFTKASIRSAPAPDAGRTRYYDADASGLVLAVTAAGSRAFYFYKRINGRPVEFRLGSIDEVTPDQARRKVAELNAGAMHGIDPRDERRVRRTSVTLGEAFEVYIDQPAKRTGKPKRAATVATYRNQLEIYLAGWITRPLASIDPIDVRRLHARLGTESGTTTANRVLALLRAIFTMARADLDYRAGDPTQGIRKYREEKRERFLMPDEVPAFLAALDAEDDHDRDAADMIRLALWSGARQRNVCACRWDQLALHRGTWTIPADEAKAGESITVHLSVPALDVLTRRQADGVDDDHVFPLRRRKGQTPHRTWPRTAWDRVLKRARLTDLRPHDLRRTLGSWLASTGASTNVVGKAIGDRSESAARVYARLTDDPVREAINRAADAILEAGKGEL